VPELCPRRTTTLGNAKSSARCRNLNLGAPSETGDKCIRTMSVRPLTHSLVTLHRLMLADSDGCRVLIRDPDAKWSRAVRAQLQDEGIRVVQRPYRAPNANAYAERFVRSIKEECLNRLIPLGERHHRRAVAE
jgi:hypothetical protein